MKRTVSILATLPLIVALVDCSDDKPPDIAIVDATPASAFGSSCALYRFVFFFISVPFFSRPQASCENRVFRELRENTAVLS